MGGGEIEGDTRALGVLHWNGTGVMREKAGGDPEERVFQPNVWAAVAGEARGGRSYMILQQVARGLWSELRKRR